MVLGPQFDNTFYNEGNETFASRRVRPSTCKHCNKEIMLHESGKWVDRSGLPTHGKEATLAEMKASKDLHEPIKDNSSPKPLQGMLFSPHTATGSSEDPLISREKWSKQISKSYQTDQMNTRFGVGDKKLAKQKEMLDTAAHNSGMPFHLLEKVNVKTRVVPMEGRAHYSPYSGIKLNEEIGSPGQAIQPEKKVPVYEEGKPIPNPNFRGINMGHPDLPYLKSAFHSYGTFFDPQGKEIHKSKLQDEEYHPDKLDPTDLPEGHSANIYPGKGKDTNKYVTNSFQVETDWSDRGRDGYKWDWYHTRHEAVPTGQTQVVPSGIKRTPGKRWISKSTLVHETGHSLDPHVNARTRDLDNPDTVIEAVADGFTDRFYHYKDRFQDEIEPSPARAKEMLGGGGYGTKHHSVGKKNLNKALYAAVRQHVSMGDNNYADMPSRDTFDNSSELSTSHARALMDLVPHFEKEQRKNLDHANTMLLGHLYDKHQHVKAILGHLGMKNIGENAAEYFRSHSTDAGRGTPGYAQGELF